MQFEFLVFKHFPINLGSTHRGIIVANGKKSAEKKLDKMFKFPCTIIRQL